MPACYLSAWRPGSPRTPYGVVFTKTDSRADVTAVTVGLHLAIGSAIIIFAAFGLYIVGMLIATLAVTGLAAVRLVEMIAGKAATTRQWILLAPEVAGTILGATLVLARLPELTSLAHIH